MAPTLFTSPTIHTQHYHVRLLNTQYLSYQKARPQAPVLAGGHPSAEDGGEEGLAGQTSQDSVIQHGAVVQGAFHDLSENYQYNKTYTSKLLCCDA